MPTDPPTRPASQPASITGVQLAQGIGHQPAKGFWADAWGQVLRRPLSVAALAWIGVVAFFAVFSPILANGHPLLLRPVLPDGSVGPATSPLIRFLTAGDLLLLLAGLLGPLWLLLPLRAPRSLRLGTLCLAFVQGVATVAIAGWIASWIRSGEGDWAVALRAKPWAPAAFSAGVAAAVGAIALAVPTFKTARARIGFVLAVALLSGSVVFLRWTPPLVTFQHRLAESRDEARSLYTAIPFSPTQGSTSLFAQEPGTTTLEPLISSIEADARREIGQRARLTDEQLAAVPLDAARADAIAALFVAQGELHGLSAAATTAAFRDAVASGELTSALDAQNFFRALPAPGFPIGTDSFGRDVLSQVLHACRLSISIGLVSTSIAVVIGVTIGSLMGYFGGWVDLLLYRVVEIFMAVPVLFLLIVAAGVLPRNTYVMMAIIGCFTWTGAARFTRAEFMKLRNMDFVQAGKAVGLPLRSILFKHMLPNGVTPVLVDTSFAIAAAILIEASLSFLGLGPPDQASWGRLLSDAKDEVGRFVWWLAIFPGAAIFLTTLAYNILGESLRDAIDPKLKKARV